MAAAPCVETDGMRRGSDAFSRTRRCSATVCFSTTVSPALSRCNSEPASPTRSPRSEPLKRFSFVVEEDVMLSLLRARLTHFSTATDEENTASPRAEPAPTLSRTAVKRRPTDETDPVDVVVPPNVLRRRGAICMMEPSEHMREAYDRVKRAKTG